MAASIEERTQPAIRPSDENDRGCMGYDAVAAARRAYRSLTQSTAAGEMRAASRKSVSINSPLTASINSPCGG